MISEQRDGRDLNVVGRDAELQRLSVWLDAIWSGEGRAAVIEGEPGIGKTALCLALLTDARRRGAQVLMGTADELEQDRPFGLILDALRGCGDFEPAAEWVERWAGAQGSVGSPRSRFEAVDEAVDLIEAMSAAKPVLVLLDDLQWVDAPSLVVANHLVKRMRHSPVGIVLSFRSGVPDPRIAKVAETVVDQQGALHLRVAPLDETAMSALLTQTFSVAPGPQLLSLATRTGGNPFYLSQLVRVLQDERLVEVADDKADVSGAPLPPSLRLTVLRRLSMFGPDCRRLLRTASFFGSTFSLAGVAAAGGISPEQAGQILEPAIYTGIVVPRGGELAFAHDLVREALYEDVPQALRRQQHQDIAMALARIGGRAGEVARHFILGVDAGTEEAIRWIRRAAHEASASDPQSAAETIDHAIRRTVSTDGSYRDMLLDQTRWLMWAARFDAAASVTTRLLKLETDPGRQCQLRLFLIQTAIVHGDLQEAMTQVAHALELPPSAERFPHVVAEAALVHLFVARSDEARGLAQEAIALGERTGDAMGIGLGQICLALVAMLRGDLVEAASLATATADLARGSPELGRHSAFLLAGRILLEADDVSGSSDLALEAVRTNSEVGTAWLLPMYHVLLGTLAFHQGQWDDALAEFDTSEALSEETGNWGSWAAVLALRAEIAVHRDDIDSARACVEKGEEIIAAAPGIHWHAGDVMWARAQLLVAEEQHDTALSLLSGLWDMRVGFDAAGANRGVAQLLLRLAHELADAERLQKTLTGLEALAARADSATVTAIATLGRGLKERDRDAILQALPAIRQDPRRPEQAGLLEDAAVALAELGDMEAARSPADETVEFYRSVGGARSRAQAEARFRRVGIVRGIRGPRARPALGWESLTPTETRIVKLVAQGLRNAEIADRLVVSPRTVETHLSHVYTKVQVGSRVRLATEAAKRFSPPAGPSLGPRGSTAVPGDPASR